MPRKRRLHMPGGFYHVILRGNARQPIFFDQEDRELWQEIIEDGLRRYQHRLHAYCWMTNHVHMSVQVGDKPLAAFMRYVASRHARKVNRKYNQTGHLFERRYRAILVQQDEYLKELLRYIHMNPVRARMVADPADYRWSSHTAYLLRTSPDWLTIEFLQRMFGQRRLSASRAYVEFMGGQPSDRIVQLLRDGAADDDRILGNDEWIQSVTKNADMTIPHQTLTEIVRDACQRHDVTEAMLASRSRSRRNSAIRAEIALAATESGCASVTEVASRFGRAHSGLSRAMNRLRDKDRK